MQILDEAAHKVSEAIASKDRNNLYVTSTFFSEPAKYRAFCAYYAAMRIVDDRIDNLPANLRRGARVQQRETKVVNAWEKLLRTVHQGARPSDILLMTCEFAQVEQVHHTLDIAHRDFPVPDDVWQSFFAAMHSDIRGAEFTQWSDFTAYCEGATVAPTTIYLALIAGRRNGTNDPWALPGRFDLRACGRQLGLFAYLGHIIRDLSADVMCGSTRLCLAQEDMSAHGVTRDMLASEALAGRASKATRSLVRVLLQRARSYGSEGRALTQPLTDHLTPDCRFILELIISIYEHIIERIESVDCDPMSNRHHLTSLERTQVVQKVAERTRFLPSIDKRPEGYR